MTRIIAGSAKGRHLKVPKSGTRPTPDRVRESVFSSLDHRFGSWAGLVVLDLFAGSGALGLEAVSRGAESAVLIENARGAYQVARDNVAVTGLKAQVVHGDVTKLLRNRSDIAFDLVFADPPYETPEVVITELLGNLVTNGWLAEDAVVLVERQNRTEPTQWPDGFDELAQRRFGDTVVRQAVWYLRAE